MPRWYSWRCTGKTEKNGKVQAAFDLLHIRYTGTGHLSSAMAMDKGLSKKLLKAAGVPVPEGVVLKSGEERRTPEDLNMKYPVVVKPCCGGSSVGVFIVNSEEEYEKALDEAFGYEDEVVVEDYIRGREFSVGVVDGAVYPVIEIAPKEGFMIIKTSIRPAVRWKPVRRRSPGTKPDRCKSLRPWPARL